MIQDTLPCEHRRYRFIIRENVMLSPKENEKIIDEYDYVLTSASARECTGLIPFLPASEEELESYNEIYHIYPPVHVDRSEK